MSGSRGVSKFYVKCWNCPLHFIGESLLERFGFECYRCGADLDRERDRVR